MCRAGTPRASTRLVPQAAERILDAPDLVDDYYLNLLDWSCGNVVAVALGAAVFLWSADDGAVQQLAPFGDAPPADGAVTSVSWAADGKHLAVGTSGSEVQIWDAAAARSVRTLRGHSARVSALAWAGSTLASGGKDTRILQHDVRVRCARPGGWGGREGGPRAPPPHTPRPAPATATLLPICCAGPTSPPRWWRTRRRCAVCGGARAGRSWRAAATTTRCTCGTDPPSPAAPRCTPCAATRLR